MPPSPEVSAAGVPQPGLSVTAPDVLRAGQITAAATAFAALFAAVGIGLYGLTFFYDFFVRTSAGRGSR